MLFILFLYEPSRYAVYFYTFILIVVSVAAVAVVIGVYLKNVFLNVLCGLVVVYDIQYVTGEAGITKVTAEGTYH